MNRIREFGEPNPLDDGYGVQIDIASFEAVLARLRQLPDGARRVIEEIEYSGRGIGWWRVIDFMKASGYRFRSSTKPDYKRTVQMFWRDDAGIEHAGITELVFDGETHVPKGFEEKQ